MMVFLSKLENTVKQYYMDSILVDRLSESENPVPVIYVTHFTVFIDKLCFSIGI